MRFNEKRYINGKEVNKVVDKNENVIKRAMNAAFQIRGDAARYEEMKMSDGRFCVSIKDRANKIIIQYKELKNGNTRNTD